MMKTRFSPAQYPITVALNLFFIKGIGKVMSIVIDVRSHSKAEIVELRGYQR